MHEKYSFCFFDDNRSSRVYPVTGTSPHPLRRSIDPPDHALLACGIFGGRRSRSTPLRHAKAQRTHDIALLLAARVIRVIILSAGFS